MRKHFLILMLLTLLPFTAWAEDITSASVAVGDIEFSTSAPGAPYVVWKGEELKKDIHYTVDANYYKKVDEDYVSVGTNLSAQPIGTYYVKISGIPSSGFNGDAYGDFKIIQKKLTIDFDQIIANYGDAAVAPTYTVAIKDGADLNPAVPAELAIINGLKIAAVVKSGSSVITVTTTTDAGAYDFDFTYNTTGNYSLERKAGDVDQYVINGKPITAAMVEMGTPGTYNYTGNNITGLPTFTVTDGETPVTFEVKWFVGAITDADTPADGAAVEPKNAGTYYARITGTGNYSGKVFDNTNWKITVNKVPLTVLVNPQSKTYDAVAYTIDNVEYTFGGLVEADQGKVNLSSLTPKVDGSAWADFQNYKAGGYEVSVDVAGATIGDPAKELADNYAVTPIASKWMINKVTGLQITAAPQSINYGDAIPATSPITSKNAVEAEKAAIEALYKAPKAGGAKNDVYGTQPNIYVPILKEVGADYANAAEKEVAEAILNNYEFADPAVIGGALNVGGINATIMPVVASANYDGKAHGATAYLANSGVYILTEDDIDVSGIKYQYKKQNADETWGDWSATAPTTIGVYRAQVVASSVSGKGSFAEAEIAPIEIQYEIKKKPINIAITGAVLHKGDTEETLVDHTTYSDYAAEIVEGEKIEFKPVFVTPIALPLKIDGDTKKITTAVNTDCTGAVTAVLVDGDNNNANYDITFTPGDLHIDFSELILAQDDAKLAAKIAEAAKTGEDYNITFGDMSFKAGSWYTMVLPFETTPYDLVDIFDSYLITDRMTSASGTKIAFTLEFNTLPANEPFLVKFAKDVNLSTKGCAGKEISSAEPKVIINDNTFMGVYTAQNIQTTDVQKVGWLATATNSGSSMSNDWKSPKSAPRELLPMEAYLIYPSVTSSPIITVEDFDFATGTTAIKSLSADQINGLTVIGKGWYTLDGKKLQGAPTEKGIYINNGKKVVLK